MDTPFITIILYIHTCEKYVERSLDSLSRQTLADIEIIILDTGSSKEVRRLVEEKKKRDGRIRILECEVNGSDFALRKKAVRAARGKTILFFNTGDVITNDFCKEVFSLYEKIKVDILHFSSWDIQSLVEKGVDSKSDQSLIPLYKRLDGEAVFKECFCEERYGFQLWNKLFSTELCKKVFHAFPDICVPIKEDFFSYFFLALEARSYLGAEVKEKYYHYYDSGEEKKQIDLVQFDRECSVANVLYLLTQYAPCQKEYVYKAVEKNIAKWTKKAFLICKDKLMISLRKEGYRKLFSAFQIEDVLNALFAIWQDKDECITKYISSDLFCDSNSGKKKRIAVFYRRIGNGGVERVISLLIPMYIRLGYEVILITEEEPGEMDYELPANIRRYVISAKKAVLKQEVTYKQRALEMKKILAEEEIGIVCYQAASSPLLFYDLLLIKYIGVKMIAVKHEMFSQHMVYGKDFLRSQRVVFPYLDKLVVLSEVEQLFWETLGVEASYIPNPGVVKKHEIQSSQRGPIVWAGRFQEYQKQQYDMIEIMRYVLSYVPDAILKMYGEGGEIENFKSEVRRAGLQEHIICCGYEKDIEKIYSGASIYLLTSAFESFSMAILESKMHGIPLVTYDMPYLEILKNKQGVSIVPQGDYEQAGQAIVELLLNKEKYEKMAEEAFHSWQSFSGESVQVKWKKVLQEVYEEKKDMGNVSRQPYSIILETMAFHYTLGWKREREFRNNCNKIKMELHLRNIQLIVLEQKLKPAIYPFGAQGRKYKEYFEKNGLKIEAVFDNGLAGSEPFIYSLDEWTVAACTEYLFIVCSNRKEIHEELLEKLYVKADRRNVYDLFSEEHGKG